ncbi:MULTISPECIES: MarR family transcriptional regulator [Kitasatospora]|uniref:Putative MarR family transcriptional regulator n=1 Tax=Kitasatospora setae (strain ATCC 33774 / DSM 43861 / JCM 3304 / KCC A-0304 / NBRC 14216 / KM-6054) TaxID=452652 RepID=E4N4Q3_KITSK|nr:MULTISPECIES: MarR family transcriptional regulator [Kitasatospora]BAJ26184.1 putative MarR family transcriptional regulator [Kitasatospora setae KM-6054]
MDDPGPGLRTVHRLRALTVELDLLAAAFARRNGLHPTDLRALIALLDAAREGTPATPGRLGRELRLNSAGTTAVLDRLERLGLVRRDRDPDDRRRVLLAVTERAVALGQGFFGPLIGETVALVEGLSPAERATVEGFLASVSGIVARHAEQAADG